VGFLVVLLAALTTGCITTAGDTISFQPKSNQQAIMRDGDAIITSRQRYSVVSVRPATHLVADHPVFIVGIQNTSKIPLDFRVTDASAGQVVNGSTNPLRVYTYDEMVSQEKDAQVGRAILVGVLSGINSGLNGDAANDTNAQAQATLVAQNQQNMTELDQLALKDHTLMPGESYAGKLYLDAPAKTDGPKAYFIDLQVGPDRHEFQVVQALAVR
jgi:hypothetical protein